MLLTSLSTEVSQPLPVFTHIPEVKKEASAMSSFFIVSLNENTKFLPSSTQFFTCTEMVHSDFLPVRVGEILHQPAKFNNLALFPEVLVELCQ